LKVFVIIAKIVIKDGSWRNLQSYILGLIVMVLSGDFETVAKNTC